MREAVERGPWMRAALLLLLVLAAAGCGRGPEVSSIPPQRWEDLVLQLQSRPDPPRPGMNEFLLIATHEGGRPGSAFLVHIRRADDPEGRWEQMIQDGRSGVYRRAIRLVPGTRAVEVRLRRHTDGRETVVRFPLPEGG